MLANPDLISDKTKQGAFEGGLIDAGPWEDRHRVFTLQITSEPSFILCVHRSPIILPEKITAHTLSLQQ